MYEDNYMQQGWDTAVRLMGANIGGLTGQEYVKSVEDEIIKLQNNINNHYGIGLGYKQLQGYMQEEWAAGTFNVDAVASGSKHRAEVLHSNAKDSVDIEIKNKNNIVSKYSAKSYADGAKSAKEQARMNLDTRKASYEGMGRLVPEDQLKAAKEFAGREEIRNKLSRKDVAEAYKETKNKLTDRIQTKDGTTSKPVKREELDQIARESKEQKFKAENHGITPKNAIKQNYLLKKAMEAGVDAALIAMAIELAPEIYKSIDYVIKHGELSPQQIKEMGMDGISAGADGFLSGAISATLTTMCLAGKLGEEFKKLNPSLIGVITVLVLQTIKNSILVAEGKMTSQEMGEVLVNTVVTSSGFLLGTYIGKAILEALKIKYSLLGYLIGTIIGSSLCAIYNIGKNKLISLCVDTGFTCFGLVDQDYTLPDQVLNEIGIETIPIPRTEIETIDIPVVEIDKVDISGSEYETITFTQVKRGLIGVNKVGYMENNWR